MIREYINYSSTNDIYFHHTYQFFPSNKRNIQNYTRKTEWHLGIEVFFLLKGKVTYFVKELEITVAKGDMLIIPSNAAHSLTADPRFPFERMVLSFPLNFLPRLSSLEENVFASCSDFNYLIPKEYVEKFSLDKLMQQCKAVCASTSPYTDLLLIAQISSIASTLYEIKKSLSVSQNPVPTRASRVYEFIRFIGDNITKNINVKDVANHFFISPSHVANTFKKEIGVPIKQYITDQKMLRACKLLLSGSPAEEVASMVGYNDYYTFFRNFKAKTKRAPKDYARSHRLKNPKTENNATITSSIPLIDSSKDTKNND